MIANDLIKASLRLIGVVVSGESPTNDEMQDALSALNIMLDNWAARDLVALGPVTENFTLTTGTAAYTIGVGQTFNTSKPFSIESAYVRDTSNTPYIDIPLEIINYGRWNGIPDKTAANGLPLQLYYDPGKTQQTTQTGTVNLYLPPDKNYTIFMSSVKPFTEFVALTDSFTFPPAYERAIKFNLAIELAPEFGTSVSAEIALIADDSFRTILRSNAKTVTSAMDFGKRRTGFYNIYSDDFR